MQIPRSLYNVKLTFCPVDTLPVKDTFATSGWWQSKLPVSCPPCTTLRSPSGAPASAKISANMTAVTGVTGDGLNTMVLPDSWNAREKKKRIDMGYVCNISPRGCTIQNSLNYVFLSDFHKRVNSTIDVKRRLWEETSTHRKLGKIWGLKKTQSSPLHRYQSKDSLLLVGIVTLNLFLHSYVTKSIKMLPVLRDKG